MNCYLVAAETSNADVTCTRIRAEGSTTLLIDVTANKLPNSPPSKVQRQRSAEAKDKRRPDEYYNDDGEKVCPPAEILYSVTDVSDVEMGHGGFVGLIKARHDAIAMEQNVSVGRGSSHLTEQLEGMFGSESESGESTPKCDSRRSSFRNTPHLSRQGSTRSTPKGRTSPRGSVGSRGSTGETVSRASSSASSTNDEPMRNEIVRAESEVAYTSITDDTDIEQGHGGFVKSVMAKHETIAIVEGAGEATSPRGSGRRSLRKKGYETVSV